MPPRPRKTEATRQIQQTLTEAAVYGAKLLLYNLRGKDAKGRNTPRVSNSKINTAKIAIEHAIGLPKAKIELKTGAMTMQDIAELAATFEDNGDVLLIPTKPVSVEDVPDESKN